MATTLIQPQDGNSDNVRLLTNKQQVFVSELLADGNYSPTEAAKKAGYSCPSQAATKLLKNPIIKSALGKAQRDREDRCQLKADAVLKELSYCALRDPLDLCDENGRLVVDDLRKIPEQIRRCIDGMKVKQEFDKEGNVTGQTFELKLVSKTSMIELAMKHFGLLQPTQHEVKHSIDWDQMYESPNGQVVDVIESRIANPDT